MITTLLMMALSKRLATPDTTTTMHVTHHSLSTHMCGVEIYEVHCGCKVVAAIEEMVVVVVVISSSGEKYSKIFTKLTNPNQ